MSKSAKSGFVIKLSTETVQKLAEEQEQAKKQAEEAVVANKLESKDSNKEHSNVTVSSEALLPTAKNQDIPQSAGEIDNEKRSIVELRGKLDTNSDSKLEDSNKKAAKEDGKAESSDSSAWGDYAPYITYEGEEAIYTDPTTHLKYTWDAKANSWTPKSGSEVPGRVYSYENDTHIYTDADGSKTFWDDEKKAWLPKVDDDFLAHYQMSYGFIDNTSKEDDDENKHKEKEKVLKEQTSGVKRKTDPQWFDASDDTNTKVYVSNLPLELTDEEFVDFMQKCGLVERDPKNQKMKVKLYMDKEQNCFKGDALCTYIKIESVDLALKLLDGSDFKGNTIKVERAHFQLKGEYNPALKPKKKKKKELEKLKKMQQKLFDWRPEKFVGERSKHERIVIIKNLFHPSDFDKDVQLILDYQQDLREESAKCGDVRKVVIYDRHPEGVAQITMKEPEQADAVVALVNGRWFGKRQITAEIFDGRTKYRIAETDADLSKRVDKWDKFLEGKEDTDASKTSVEPDASKIPVEPDASKTSVEPDASKTSVEPDASKTSIEPDASKIPVEPDASKTSVEPDASKTPVEPDASKTSVEPDASKTSVEPDASKTPVEPDASKTSVEPDASKTSVEPDASKTSVEPDASKTPVEPDASKTPVEPDASKTSVEPDASKTSVEPDASKTPVEPDASKTPVEPDGGKTLLEPGKAVEGKTEDVAAAEHSIDQMEA